MTSLLACWFRSGRALGPLSCVRRASRRWCEALPLYTARPLRTVFPRIAPCSSALVVSRSRGVRAAPLVSSRVARPSVTPCFFLPPCIARLISAPLLCTCRLCDSSTGPLMRPVAGPRRYPRYSGIATHTHAVPPDRPGRTPRRPVISILRLFISHSWGSSCACHWPNPFISYTWGGAPNPCASLPSPVPFHLRLSLIWRPSASATFRRFRFPIVALIPASPASPRYPFSTSFAHTFHRKSRWHTTPGRSCFHSAHTRSLMTHASPLFPLLHPFTSSRF